MNKNIIETLQKIQDYVYGGENFDPKPLPSLTSMVEEARQEWLNAQRYYNMVTDKDLVDHAVYLMQAAEKKYMYLLKKARQEGIVRSPYSTPDIDDKGQ